MPPVRQLWTAAVLVLAPFGTPGVLPNSVSGYVLYQPAGAYNNASIADGELFACFHNNTPVYTHRAILMSGLRKWGDAIVVDVESNGRCDMDGSNVEVWWDGQPFDNDCAWGYAGVPIPSSTYSTTQVYFNASCGAGAFWWGGTNPVPNGQIDAYSTAIHEMGHAYGLNHTEWFIFGLQVLEESTSCILDSKRLTSLSADDAAGIRARYPGLLSTGNAFNGSAGCID